jgi:GNAT superfamily N-acetyltransferase
MANHTENNHFKSGGLSEAVRDSLLFRYLDPHKEAAILGLLRADKTSCTLSATVSEGLDNHSRHTSPLAHWMVGVFFADELTGFVRACDGSFDGHIETALFVEERWRRQGIGSLLLGRAMDWGSRRKGTKLRFVCATTDWPMRHFAQKFGARLDLVLGRMVADFPIEPVHQ